MRIIRYLGKHKIALLVVVCLLVVEAFADLSIPNLTSQIVDVGIQQSGVEDVAVTDMTERSYDLACALAAEDDESLIRESYDRQDDGTYRMNEAGFANREELNDILAMPLVAAHSGAGAAGEGAEGAAGDAGDLPVEMLGQASLAAARAEYEAAGVDLAGMQTSFLIRTGLAMLGLAALAMIAFIAVGFVASRTGARIGYDLRSALFSRAVEFSEAEISHFSAASLITRGTNDIVQIQNVSTMLLRMVLYAPILAIGGIIMVMTTNAAMGWVVVVAIVAVFVVIAVVFSVALPKFKVMQKLIDRVNLVAREILTGMPVIRAFNRQPLEQQRFDDASKRLMKTQLFTNRVMTFMMPAMMLIMNATSVAIVWVGGRYIDAGTIQTGDLIAFITYAMVIIMSFLIIGMISIMLPRADVAAERVNEVIAYEPSIHDPENPAPLPELARAAGADAGAADAGAAAGGGAASAADAGGAGADPATPIPQAIEVEFDDVSFAYNDSKECVLEHVSFVAEAGKVTAIVGSTGSGKSTVIKLIERFYDASSGAVRVNGVDVRDLSQAELRAQFGYVPQKAFLFTGDVRSNVSYGDESMDVSRVDEALSVAQASGFVADKEEGLDFPIAQGGSNVSGGQRQRLAIARALAVDAPAYLFDDSFSALDYKTDSMLRQQMKLSLGNVTQIIVAQRIATIMDADRIVVLDEGRVAGIGTHLELMESCEEYREIALSQLSEEELMGGGEL